MIIECKNVAYDNNSISHKMQKKYSVNGLEKTNHTRNGGGGAVVNIPTLCQNRLPVKLNINTKYKQLILEKQKPYAHIDKTMPEKKIIKL